MKKKPERIEIPAQDLSEAMRKVGKPTDEFPEGPWLAYPGERKAVVSSASATLLAVAISPYPKSG